jgi:hypothetical protein
MSKSNTVQNGKGDKPRVSSYSKYWGSPLWDNLKKDEKKSEEKTKKNK